MDKNINRFVDSKNRFNLLVSKTINDFGSPAETSKEPLLLNDFKEGSNSAISAYHDASDSEKSIPTLPYQNLSSPLKSSVGWQLIHPILMHKQNLQSEKSCFFTIKQFGLKKKYYSISASATPIHFSVAGAIIHVNLVTPINSDLPGHIYRRSKT